MARHDVRNQLARAGHDCARHLEPATSPVDRRALLRAALAAPLVAAFAPSLTACGGSPDPGPTGPGPATAAPVAMSSVPRAPADAAAANSAAGMVAGFAGRLLRQLSPEIGAGPAKNVLVSPYSIVAALAMTRLGARGATATAMDTTLGWKGSSGSRPSSLSSSTDGAPLAAGMGSLAQQLASYAGEVKIGDRTDSIVWNEANSLWGQQGIAWERPFLDALARNFGAGMRQVDYQRAAAEAIKAINAWTSQATAGKIRKIVDAALVDASTRLVLVNAVHFKAPWLAPFQREMTTPATFTHLDGSTVQVDMMSGARAVSGARGPGYIGAVLPYVDEKFGYAVVLPDVGRERVVHERLCTQPAQVLTNLTKESNVDVEMPRMSLRQHTDLGETLRRLGMGAAFEGADFSGMTRAEALSIGFVVHEATLDVDEWGTEAAAATAVGMLVSAPAPSRLRIRLDRPFYVILHDAKTSTPLFLAYVADPTAP